MWRNGRIRKMAWCAAMFRSSSKDSVFARYSRTSGPLDTDAALPAPTGDPISRQTDSTSAGLGYTRTLSPTFINELRFTWTTITMAQDATVARNEIIPGSLDPLVDSGTPDLQHLELRWLTAHRRVAAPIVLFVNHPVFGTGRTISRSRSGAHVFKFGGEFMLIRPDTFATSNGRSSFGFTGVFTQNPQSRSNSGNALADLLLGDANSLTTGTTAQAIERGWFGGGYFQDQWTVNSQLTINLGVRYEYSAPYIETQNRMANLILDAGNPLYGQFILAGDKRLPRSLISGDHNNVAPRVGLAWHVPGAGDLVVRSSYGIFYAQDEGTGVTNRMTSNPPFYGYGSQTISSDQLNPATGFRAQLGSDHSAPGCHQSCIVRARAFCHCATCKLAVRHQNALRPAMEFQRAKDSTLEHACRNRLRGQPRRSVSGTRRRKSADGSFCYQR